MILSQALTFNKPNAFSTESYVLMTFFRAKVVNAYITEHWIVLISTHDAQKTCISMALVTCIY